MTLNRSSTFSLCISQGTVFLPAELKLQFFKARYVVRSLGGLEYFF
jgi:hypothetical protein